MKISKRFLSAVLIVLMMVISSVTVAADAPNGPIANNGKNGINIDILSYPYTHFANKNYGQNAYGKLGCAWFANSRLCQLTGYNGAIWSGYSWYNSQYASYGFSRGRTIRAKSLVCYENHIAVVERVDGNVVTISEGGVQDKPGNSHCQITTCTVAELEAYTKSRLSFLGYVYIGVAVDSEPLTVPEISLDKTSYFAGETVNVTWKPSSVNSPLSHYWISVYTPSGATLLSTRVENTTSYSFTVSESGKYHVVVSATPVGSQAGEGSLTHDVYVDVVPPIQKPTLSVSASDAVTPTVFSWSTSEKILRSVLTVTKKDGTFSKEIELGITGTPKKQNLSAGDYTAFVTIYTNSGVVSSDTVEFNVKESSDNNNWVYADTLPSGVTADKYEIQYEYTYNQITDKAPASGWTKGEFVKTEYVNSGAPYESTLELTESDTRVLTDYYYYHFCSGSQGNSANFAFTNVYNHFDSISKDNVYVASVNTDYDDSRYKYYHLKWTNGADAYCSSGVSCDGAFGTHGNRTFYWYKNFIYQDKIRLDYYNYFMTGDWTTALESDYSQVKYRYRLRDGGVFGDANGDGKVTVSDATMIQKHCASLLTLSSDAQKLADTDRNGRISVSDATRIQKHIAGILPQL